MISLLFFQIIVNIILFKLLWWCYKKFELEINLYNLPIIIMCMMVVIGGAYLVLTKNMLLYLPTGALLGMFIWTLNSIEAKDHPRLPLLRKLMISIAVSIVWPQIMVFMIFYGTNYDKINLDE